MFLADDGQQGDISIPAILISKTDGEKIINYYMLNKDNKEEIKKIRFEIKFDLENKNNIVNYDIWYTPDTENVYTFFKDFEKYQKALGDSAKMGVHFVTYPHFMYKSEDKTPKDDCLGSGLYCIRPGKLGITDGRIIVLESIKQKCIYDYTLNQNKLDLFWKFMIQFHDKCIENENFNEVCSNNVISDVGINSNEINDCVIKSFEGTSYEKQQPEFQKVNKNNLLDNEYQLRKQFSISRVPSMIINGRLYMGNWKPDFIFDALCASLIKKPEACYLEGNSQREIKGFSVTSICMIIAFVLFINIFLFAACKKYITDSFNKKIMSTDINARIDTVVNSYIALRETKEGQ